MVERDRARDVLRLRTDSVVNAFPCIADGEKNINLAVHHYSSRPNVKPAASGCA